MGALLRQMIDGFLTQDSDDPSSNVVVKGEITKTRIVNQTSSKVYPDFINKFNEFYEDLVMSFISERNLEIAMDIQVDCMRTRWENRFKYAGRGRRHRFDC